MGPSTEKKIFSIETLSKRRLNDFTVVSSVCLENHAYLKQSMLVQLLKSIYRHYLFFVDVFLLIAIYRS